MAEFPSSFGQIPLEMATEPGTVIEDAEQNRIDPLAIGLEHAQGAVMKIQMPQSVDILAFVTADLAGLITMLGHLSARTVRRPTASSLEQPVAFHVAQQRDIGRHGAGLRLLLDQHRQIVGVKLITPTGMLAMLQG